MASQQTEIDASRMPERWTQFLSKRFGHFDGTNLERFLVSERNDHHVLPAAEDAFRSLMLTPPDRVNVVIFGQDPYPTPGHAHGLSFSVRSGVSLPASLRNIFRELKDDLGIPPARNGDLTEWATQGVLLLNRVLTVRAGAAGSHRGQGWEALTDQIIASINSGSRRVVFLLWGNDAKTVRPQIDESRHHIIESAHPSPLSARRGFFGSKPFSRTNTALVEFGRVPINWQLTDRGE